ncbi:SPX domain-containing protein [Dissophora ornata]|nr:SPX domain-containing protein [Dissophora ornata]
MKFGKALETNAEAMPEGWRPYVIQYKALKKKINAIVKELDDRGLPSPIIKSLLSQSMAGDMHQDKEHLKTCIKVVIDDLDLGPDDANAFGPVQLSQEEQISKLVLVIELTADTAFFDQLGDEISQLSKLQLANKHKFESKVEDLGKILTVVSSPNNKDISTRSSEKAQKQLQWFLTEMDRSKLVHKFKQPKSKIAFNTFFQLNSELITMKQFRELNQMAMTKILKKHDKRTNLTASSGFPKHLQNEPFYSDNISKSLTYTIGNQLVSIIPQPDDYACPICMSVAWKPIRLRCKHMFCVRCLIKAQRKNMIHCPVCRQPNSVSDADASNLDVSMMNFMKLYFPKEIKEKRKESNREQAAEEMEAFTGQRWSEVPDSACVIM